MKRMKRLAGAVLIVMTSSSVTASTADFYICANTTADYLIGRELSANNGVFRRSENGWAHEGYNDAMLTAAAFDPRDRKVCYTTSLNGLWRTLDGGKTWRMCNSWEMTEGRDVAVDPNAPDHVYLALPDGVAVSTDRAQTLVRKEHGLPDREKYTQVIKVDRIKAGRVLAGCEVGIFLTEDAAENWRCVSPTKETVNDIQQSPHDPKLWFAVTQSEGALRSRDGGRTWEKLADMPSGQTLYNIALDPTNPQRLVIGSWAHGVHTSEDGGETWQLRNKGLPDTPHVWRVGIAPEGRLYTSIYRGTLFYSDDFGRTWTPDSLNGSFVNSFVTVSAQ